jgi:molybdopterin synthase sulfur carrier subunit
MATVLIPAACRADTDGAARVDVAGSTVGEVLAGLGARFPALGARLLDARGAPRRHVAVFVRDEDIRSQQGLETPCGEREELLLVPALAGG